MEPIERPPARGAAPPTTDLPAPKGATAPWMHARLRVERPLRLTAHQRAVLGHWSTEGAPLEACGLLVGRETERGTEVVSVHHARNIEAGDPRTRFTLAPEDWLRIEDGARAEGLEVVGVWHSHPGHPALPSRSDHDGAWGSLSYVIASVDTGGVASFKSWRLVQGRFAEQPIEESHP